MRLKRISAKGSPQHIWAVPIALATLIAGCSSDIESPSMPTDMPVGSGTTVDADGNVIDANGQVVGMVDADGNVVDQNGNVVGPAPGGMDTSGTGAGSVPGSTGTGTGETAPPGGSTDTPGGETDGPGPVVVTSPDEPIVTGCDPVIPGSTAIPRLTNAQYDRTLRDLLGVTSNPSSLLATEQGGALTALAWDGYQGAARTVAAEVMANPTLKANFMKCTPMGDGAACLSETIAEFGRRAYRRPLTAEEIADFENLVALGPDITANGTPDEIAQVILNAFLVSPSFLQRAELAEAADGNGNFTLTSHEVASRLSYMLWGSMPDPELDDAADAGTLTTQAQILSQAQRMIADPKAREVVGEFHRTYLHLTANSRWDTVVKDPNLFPDFVAESIGDMIGETESLFDKVFTSGGGFQDLLLTNVAYVTESTAHLYGLDPSAYGPEPTEVTLDAETRPGFLTRVAFLTAYSAQYRTSPILRGAFITKDILGIDPGTPDPAAANTPLPATDEVINTNRKQVEKQTEPAGCAGCHQTFVNPPGFVMEAYDTTGAVQTAERDTGASIDTTAEVRFSLAGAAEPINTPLELMTRIAGSASAQRHYAEKWAAFAYQRVLAGTDHCAVDNLSQQLNAGGYSIQDLIIDLTQTESFTTRALEVNQ